MNDMFKVVAQALMARRGMKQQQPFEQVPHGTPMPTGNLADVLGMKPQGEGPTPWVGKKYYGGHPYGR